MADYGSALLGAGAAIIGGLLTGAYENVRDWFNRPVLDIDYEGKEGANRVENEYLVDGTKKEEVYIRARVRNVGRHPAKNCRVFLARVSEVKGKHLGETAFCDAKPIAWAGWDFLPRDVPKGADFYVDITRVSKGTSGWIFSVERLFASQDRLKEYTGTYRFHLLATADNAAPKEYAVDVEYNGNWNALRAWHESGS
jgi:hypothetical protein